MIKALCLVGPAPAFGALVGGVVGNLVESTVLDGGYEMDIVF